MKFFRYTENLIKQNKKDEIYTTNPFKQNNNVTLIWIDSTPNELEKEKNI